MPSPEGPRKRPAPTPLSREPRASRALSPTTRRTSLPTVASLQGALAVAVVAATLAGGLGCAGGERDAVRPDAPKTHPSSTTTATSKPTAPPTSTSTAAPPPIDPSAAPPPLPGRMAPVTPPPVATTPPSPSASVAPCPRPPAVRGKGLDVLPAPSAIPPKPHPPDVDGGEASVHARPLGARRA